MLEQLPCQTFPWAEQQSRNICLKGLLLDRFFMVQYRSPCIFDKFGKIVCESQVLGLSILYANIAWYPTSTKKQSFVIDAIP